MQIGQLLSVLDTLSPFWSQTSLIDNNSILGGREPKCSLEICNIFFSLVIEKRAHFSSLKTMTYQLGSFWSEHTPQYKKETKRLEIILWRLLYSTKHLPSKYPVMFSVFGSSTIPTF